MTDPYRLVPDAYCPSCGVKGRIVEEEYSEECDCAWTRGALRSCVECGSRHEAPFQLDADGLKAQRVTFGRLIEGRPYEPPKPVPREPSKVSETAEVFDKLLRECYSAGRVSALAGWLPVRSWFGNVECTKPGYNGVATIPGDPPEIEAPVHPSSWKGPGRLMCEGINVLEPPHPMMNLASAVERLTMALRDGCVAGEGGCYESGERARIASWILMAQKILKAAV